MSRFNDDMLCSQIRSLLPNIKTGTLRFWGNWFGRPYDNIHQIIGCEIQHDHVLIHFNCAEKLEVWNAFDFNVTPVKFEIRCADRVRWHWYSYGMPSVPENLFFLDYLKRGDRIDFTTNENWHSTQSVGETLGNAVELL